MVRYLRIAVLVAFLGIVVLAAYAGERLWDWITAPDPIPMPPPVLSLVEEVTAEVSDLGKLPTGSRALRWVAEGRVLPEPAGGQGLSHEWPGVAVQARFTGDKLSVAFDDPENRFRLLIDGRPVAMVTRPRTALVALSGLGPGMHHLRLERLSEAGSPRAITGIFVPPGGDPLSPPALPMRRIDVFGDSDSVGYGNMRTSRYCFGDDVFLSTDTTAAWPARLARRYAAHANVVARSGISVVRGGPGHSILALRDRVLPSSQAPRVTADPAWLVIVEVGGNDFARPIEPGEPWPDVAALSSAFTLSFGELLRDVVRSNPGSPVVVLAIPDPGVQPRPELEQGAAVLQSEGSPVSFVTLGGLDYRACHWHPSLSDHVRIEAAMAATIDALVLSGALEAK